jgi:ribosomal protein S18 acetylase RimI-like enzyme
MSLAARPATPEDGGLLLEMSRAFHLEDGSPLDAAGEATLGDVAAGVALAPAYLLLENATVVGFFILTLGYSVENGGTDGFIDDIYLIPQVRGRGLGKRAVALALEEARKCGIRVLLLEVEAHNARAYNLYLDAGFTDTKRRLLRLVLAQEDDPA